MTEPLRHLSSAEYLALDRAAETKHQYLGGEVFAMAGASFRHNQIVANLLGELVPQLRDRPCRVLPSDLRVAVSAEGPFFYPDAVALCTEPRFLDGERDTLLNPELVVEVLSPSTEAFDRGLKSAHYRSIPSLREVLFIAQDARRAELLSRQEQGGWLLSDFGADAAIELGSLGCRLEMARVYDKIDL